jgi:hypothetical protein
MLKRGAEPFSWLANRERTKNCWCQKEGSTAKNDALQDQLWSTRTGVVTDGRQKALNAARQCDVCPGEKYGWRTTGRKGLSHGVGDGNRTRVSNGNVGAARTTCRGNDLFRDFRTRSCFSATAGCSFCLDGDATADIMTDDNASHSRNSCKQNVCAKHWKDDDAADNHLWETTA